MFKKILFFSLILIGLIGVIYPSKEENSKLFNYCHALEKLLLSNSLNKREIFNSNVKKISKDIAKLGVNKTNGALINKIIIEYKNSKNSYIVSFVPNKIYCLTGYWIEKVNPGIFESIIYERSKKKINELNNLKVEVDGMLDKINQEYRKIEKDLKSFF